MKWSTTELHALLSQVQSNQDQIKFSAYINMTTK